MPPTAPARIPRIAVIGAGCSGITALKNLLEAGLTNTVCYEGNTDVGGNWIYSEKPSHSSVCETTHIISSKTMSAYLDYPMPEDYPDYPSHAQVLAYFRSYARHFGLYDYIQFSTRVERAIPVVPPAPRLAPGGQAAATPETGWQLKLSSGETEWFDYLVLANGHHNVPRHPEKIRADFKGEYLHSHDYKKAAPFAGKRVLVVGGGNSACDCAVEISRVAERVDISLRSPKYIIPKFLLGRPTDTFNEATRRLPHWLAEKIRRVGLFLQVGDYHSYGLEKPSVGVTKLHPTLNSELLYKIRHGRVHPHKGVERVVGKLVTFADGSSREFDTLVAATGFKIAFPFFDSSFLNYEEADRVPLYLRMFHADHPRLIFIGLVQPQGAVWPLSDAQARLAAAYIKGEYTLPSDIAARAEADSDRIEKNFVRAKQLTIEVHYHDYLEQVQRELRKKSRRKQTVTA